MNRRHPPLFGAVSALVIGGTLLTPATARAQPEPPPDVQVLTRGPVHEAFAETVSFDPTASSSGTNRGGSDPNSIRQVPGRQA
ncbi:MAG: hypothetical protein K9N23_21105, partial [Akkermansiaceae bacterium]|nr:hypothetical protein [Akkermansiaceae bacterium]